MERLATIRKKSKSGYVTVVDHFGILGETGARVAEHRLIAAVLIGRPLEDGEMVHHLDLDRSNNSPENLVVVNPTEHGTFHRDGNIMKRKKARRQISFEGNTPFLKMKCPWCGKIFFKRKSDSVLAHDNKMHVNCCSIRCSNLLNDALENGSLPNAKSRISKNVVCEFKSNGAFMDRFVSGLYPSFWTIDDDGVFHGDEQRH